MLVTYYNYREIDLSLAQSLYPDWQVGIMCEITEQGLVDKTGCFSIGRPIERVHMNPSLGELNATLQGHLLIEMKSLHWYEYEVPLNKFQRGPYATADVGYDARPQDSNLKRMGDTLFNGRLQRSPKEWLDPVSFLPVHLWVADFTKLSHFVETYPYEATHILYCYDKPINHYETRFDDLFDPRMLACYVCKNASFILAELSLAALTFKSIAETTPLAETDFRVQMTLSEAAFQRKVGPTCPSTTAMRLHGAFEHGLVPDDLRSNLGYLD